MSGVTNANLIEIYNAKLEYFDSRLYVIKELNLSFFRSNYDAIIVERIFVLFFTIPVNTYAN